MANVNTSNAVDTFMIATDQAAMRTALALGDSATKNTGTTSGTVAAGDDSRITGAVQTSRTVSAGTGLTGGGDLSANRTLSVSYGTTAGTSCQGNDSRLSDARVPTGTATGDLDGTYPAPTVRRIQGRTVSSTAPTDNQVLGWNGTQWVPMTVSGGGASETYPVLAVLFVGETSSQTYSIPTGYAWADIFVGSGGDGGSGGEIRAFDDVNSWMGGTGGNGGANGNIEVRRNVYVFQSQIIMSLGAGGAGGLGGVLLQGTDTFASGSNGGTGGDSLVGFSTPPNGSTLPPNHMIARAQRTGVQRLLPTFGNVSGGTIQANGQTPTVTSWNNQEPPFLLQPGGGGGGSGTSATPITEGGRHCDALEMLYTFPALTPIDLHGRPGNIDASAITTTNGIGFFGTNFGGAGGAGIYIDQNLGYTRAGDGSAAMPGCGGGGGGGAFFDNQYGIRGDSRAGNGGAGGPGFLLMILKK